MTLLALRPHGAIVLRHLVTPASPLSSLPPEDDVPLPLGFDRLAVPVVGVSTCGLAPCQRMNAGRGTSKAAAPTTVLKSMEPIPRTLVSSVGLSKAGSNSSRRTLALDFEFG
jgi:hypothetical protein